jgi:hypothetical protein
MRVHLLAILLLTGCYDAAQIPDGHDAGGVDCATNSPPFIANVEMNSIQPDGGDGLYIVTLHFDWADPGIAGAADRPNMAGGYISGELQDFTFPTVWITPEELVSTCIAAPELADICGEAGHGTNGCSSVDDLESCTQGELTLVGTSDDGGYQKYEQLLLEFRVRDRCGDQSNFKLIEYEVGSGHLVETPPAE